MSRFNQHFANERNKDAHDKAKEKPRVLSEEEETEKEFHQISKFLKDKKTMRF